MIKQKSIVSLFTQAKETTKELPKQAGLQSDDPIIQQFYQSLADSEQVAHKIAVQMLGTSYDVSRTHAFKRWSSKT